MIRAACLLGLVALAALGMLVLRADGASAIVFSFIGFPTLAAAMALYGLHRMRAGTSPPTP